MHICLLITEFAMVKDTYEIDDQIAVSIELIETHIASVRALIRGLHCHLEMHTDDGILEKGVEAMMLMMSLYQRIEEFLMVKHNYPNIEDHMKDYEPFAASILTIGLPSEDSESDFVNLENFSSLLREHIEAKDSDLINFLKAKLANQQAG